ncbi:MAG: hypothetical protein JJU29_08470 [Verrucomicrobia bacterium]|nr:hypothetical protein [Verrucomicrobiota bacterium]MCH8512453.1 hypothetical protein [Kiritimatiellia bacterium]
MTLSRKIILGVFLFFVFLLLPLGLLMLPIWDGPLPDDADMMVPVREIPEEENAYALYLEAYEKLDMPDGNVLGKWVQNPDAHLEEIQAELTSNAESFEWVEQGIRRGDYQPPFDPELAYGVAEVLELGRSLSIFARVAPTPGERMAFARTLSDFTKSYARTEGPLIIGLIRNAVETFAHEAFRVSARNPDIPTEDLGDLLERIKPLGPRSQQLERGYPLEYQYFIREFEADEMEMLNRTLGKSRTSGFWVSVGFLYQPNNTRRLVLDIFRARMDHLEEDFGRGPVPIQELLEYELEYLPQWNPRFWFNRTGRTFAMEYHKNMNVEERFLRSQADHAATLLILALNLWHHEHGELPERLEELVPEFLAEIPADPYDGEPFRYNRERARIYALGENLTDYGGSARSTARTKARRTAEDFVYGIFEEIDFFADSP